MMGIMLLNMMYNLKYLKVQMNQGNITHNVKIKAIDVTSWCNCS